MFPQHARAGITHHVPGLFTPFALVAMHGTIGAGGFGFAETAAFQPHVGIGEKRLAFGAQPGAGAMFIPAENAPIAVMVRRSRASRRPVRSFCLLAGRGIVVPAASVLVVVVMRISLAKLAGGDLMQVKYPHDLRLTAKREPFDPRQ